MATLKATVNRFSVHHSLLATSFIVHDADPYPALFTGSVHNEKTSLSPNTCAQSHTCEASYSCGKG